MVGSFYKDAHPPSTMTPKRKLSLYEEKFIKYLEKNTSPSKKELKLLINLNSEFSNKAKMGVWTPLR
jgi:hypothetical protein